MSSTQVNDRARLEHPHLRDALLTWRRVDRTEAFTDEWWDALGALRDVADRIETGEPS